MRTRNIFLSVLFVLCFMVWLYPVVMWIVYIIDNPEVFIEFLGFMWKPVLWFSCAVVIMCWGAIWGKFSA